MNDPDVKSIFDRMEAEGFDIIEDMSPEESKFYDYSVSFMYPHQVDLLKVL
jgi:hypothetical protein